MDGRYGVVLVVASTLVITQVQYATSAISATDLMRIKEFREMFLTVKEMKTSMKEMAKEVMAAQVFVEERIRSDGHSGLKQARAHKHGNEAYFESTTIDKAAMAVHDHSNSHDILGSGEYVAVINGVEFRPRHNDAHIRQKSTTDRSYNAVENIKFPEVPREVLRKPTVEAQVMEMQKWIKAFAEQDHSVRDYRKYFRPIFCYMEGFWTLDKHLTEPFVARRHSLEATTWDQLLQQIQYTSYSGGKHLKENFSFLPRKIISINETDGTPVHAQWNYNILCHPYSGDIPTKYFRQQDDWALRQANGRTLEQIRGSRSARFRLSEFDKPQYTQYTLLDKIMAEIPGKDNIPNRNLNEEPLGQTLYDPAKISERQLNTGFYHRMYKTGTPDASGKMNVHRGFSDAELFFAETTQERIAPMGFRKCENKRSCVFKSTRFTWAIPLEVVYLTPLLTWNPYNISISEDISIPTEGKKRNGKLSADKAYKGASYYKYFYITPSILYAAQKGGQIDPADTVGGTVGVLDKRRRVRETVASGTRILLPSIPGIDVPVRLRWPVYSLHVEGSNIWKELQAVKLRFNKNGGSAAPSAQKNEFYLVKMDTSNKGEEHVHEFTLTKEEYDAAIRGETISVTTSLENGHNHDLEVIYDKTHKSLWYTKCDNAKRCFDSHPKTLTIE